MRRDLTVVDERADSLSDLQNVASGDALEELDTGQDCIDLLTDDSRPGETPCAGTRFEIRTSVKRQITRLISARLPHAGLLGAGPSRDREGQCGAVCSVGPADAETCSIVFALALKEYLGEPPGQRSPQTPGQINVDLGRRTQRRSVLTPTVVSVFIESRILGCEPQPKWDRAFTL